MLIFFNGSVNYVSFHCLFAPILRVFGKEPRYFQRRFASRDSNVFVQTLDELVQGRLCYGEFQNALYVSSDFFKLCLYLVKLKKSP